MGSPVWSHEGIYAVANAHKDKVKITFSHGAELLDPNKLFNACLGGNEWRAIDFREEDRIDGTALKALRRETVAFNTKQSASKRKGPAVAAKPTLLSGGNPQIAKADGDAPVQAYIAAMPDRKSEVGRRFDDLIVGNAPTVRKAVRWNSPFYGIEGQGWFLSYHVSARHVKVTFFQGRVTATSSTRRRQGQGLALDRHLRKAQTRRGTAGRLDPAGGRPARLARVLTDFRTRPVIVPIAGLRSGGKPDLLMPHP